MQPKRKTADYAPVADSYLGLRLEALRQAQNADGGWSYFPNKSSWLEPTIYAALALHGSPEADRAWNLVKAWQNADGGWRPAADVEISHAATSLSVTAALARQESGGETGEPVRKAVSWLLGLSGEESTLSKRAILRIGKALGMVQDERDFSLKGWPWKPDTASWVEPTSHALVALRQAARKDPKLDTSELRERVRLGEGMLLDVRARDFGWNYGNRTARGEDLRSYPETTGIALVGLQGHSDLGKSLELAQKMLRDSVSPKTGSPMAAAWLTIAMRVHDVPVEEPSGALTGDTLITALEALGAAEGNHRLMRVTA